MKWFKHDTDASADAKLKKVRHKYGFEGYGFYWYLVECIASGVSKRNITFQLEEDIEIISIDWRMDKARIAEMMNYFIAIKLLGSDGESITCFKLAKRLDDTNSKNVQIKQLLKVIEANRNEENIPLNIKRSELVGVSPSESNFVHPEEIRLEEIRLEEKEIKDIVENSEIEIDLNEIDFSEQIEPDFSDQDDYQSFLSSEQTESDKSKEDKKKAKEKKLIEAEEFFLIFWCAGMRKSGDKKKALNKFISLAKERKQTLQEFAEFLKADIELRISNNQFGFESLLPTTYLNGKRYDDEQTKQQQQLPKGNHGISQRDFEAGIDGTESAAVQTVKRAIAERKRNEAATRQTRSDLGSYDGSIFEQMD